MSNELHRKSSSYAVLPWPRRREFVWEETVMNAQRYPTANRRQDTNRPSLVANVDVEQNLWSDLPPGENSRELNRQTIVTCTTTNMRTDDDGWSFGFLEDDRRSAGAHGKHVRIIILLQHNGERYLFGAVGCHHGLAWQLRDNGRHRVMDRCEYVPDWHRRQARLLCSLWTDLEWDCSRHQLIHQEVKEAKSNGE